MINVTKSVMPDFDKYASHLRKLWESRWLTNNGEYLVELEERLKVRFNTSCVTVSNGTLALMLALETIGLNSDAQIITTPFSFVATTSSILWEKYEPVFVDIAPETFNIDPDKIEEKITDKTKAILAVHVFGNPCDVERMEQIAMAHNLKIIYDAAHCFDVFYNDNSVYKFGDLATASFHATKVFHTIEGGAIFSDNVDLIEKTRKLRNFGFDEKGDIVEVGINAKMNEFQAAMGLLNLDLVDEEIRKREQRCNLYKELLNGTGVSFQQLNPRMTKYNYIYMPILFPSNRVRESVFEELYSNGYNSRRYFYPSLNSIFSSEDCPISEDISSRILHLPLYGDLELDHVEKICTIIRRTIVS